MNFVTPQEIAGRLDCIPNSLELVGDVGSIGHILVNGAQRIGILVFDEDTLMNMLDEVMRNFFALHEAYIASRLELWK